MKKLLVLLLIGFIGIAEAQQKIKYGNFSPQLKADLKDTNSAIVKTYSYGSKIQNVLAKLLGRYITHGKIDTVRIRLIGDSVSANTNTWSYFVRDSTFTLNMYGTNIIIDFQNYSYGGYNFLDIYSFFEDVIINPNIDLYVVAEGSARQRDRMTTLENMIRQIRSRSTADIIIQTYQPISTNAKANDVQARLFRALAHKYNCELLDSHYGFQSADNLNALYPEGEVTHPDSLGHEIFYDLFKSILDTTDLYTKFYNTNALSDVKYSYQFEDPLILLDSTNIELKTSGWGLLYANDSCEGVYNLYSATANDSLELDFNGVGFDLYYNQDATGGSLAVFVDDSIPSAYRVNNRPLEYSTPPLWESTNSTANHFNRFFKVIINDTTSGLPNYYITIIDTSVDSCQILQDTINALDDESSLLFYWACENTASEIGNGRFEGLNNGAIISSDTFKVGNFSLKCFDDDANGRWWVDTTGADGNIISYVSGRIGCYMYIETYSASTLFWDWTSGKNRIRFYGLDASLPTRIRMNYEGDENFYVATTVLTLDDSTWYFVECAWDTLQDSLWIYLDGVLSGTLAGITPFATDDIPTLMKWETSQAGTDIYYDQIMISDDYSTDLYALRDEKTSTVVGYGNYDSNVTTINGDLTLPLNYGVRRANKYENNPFENSDRFPFTIVRNWIDYIDMDGAEDVRQKVRVFGLENKTHTLKLKTVNTDTIQLDAIKIFQPPLGRR